MTAPLDDLLTRCGDTVRVGILQMQGFGAQSFELQGQRRVDGLCPFGRGEHDVLALPRQHARVRDDFGTLRAGDKCDLFHGRASFVDNIYQGRTSPKVTSLPLVPLASSSASATLVRAPSPTSISPPP